MGTVGIGVDVAETVPVGGFVAVGVLVGVLVDVGVCVIVGALTSVFVGVRVMVPVGVSVRGGSDCNSISWHQRRASRQQYETLPDTH